MRFRPAFALAAATFLVTGAAAQTQDPMSLAEFDAYAIGKTLTWSQFGSVYGIEEYLPNRKVRWKTAPDRCEYGHWYERDAFICFTYEYSTGEHCWTFWLEDGQLKALAAGGDPSAELVEVEQTADGLACPAPDVGV